jgi:hypothetical protein
MEDELQPSFVPGTAYNVFDDMSQGKYLLLPI